MNPPSYDTALVRRVVRGAGLALLLGVPALAAWILPPHLRTLMARRWEEGTCGVEAFHDLGESLYGHRLHRYAVRYRLESAVSERVSFYMGDELLATPDSPLAVALRAGEPVPCWRDPERPDELVLDRELRASQLVSTVLLLGFGAWFGARCLGWRGGAR